MSGSKSYTALYSKLGSRADHRARIGNTVKQRAQGGIFYEENGMLPSLVPQADRRCDLGKRLTKAMASYRSE
jgi:hypothetical protein